MSPRGGPRSRAGPHLTIGAPLARASSQGGAQAHPDRRHDHPGNGRAVAANDVHQGPIRPLPAGPQRPLGSARAWPGRRSPSPASGQRRRREPAARHGSPSPHGPAFALGTAYEQGATRPLLRHRSPSVTGTSGNVCLMGINTSTCVLNTAFTAFNLDYRVVVLSDCVASTYGEDLHVLGLHNVARCLGWVLSNAAFHQKMRGPAARRGGRPPRGSANSSIQAKGRSARAST